jgi:Flp pilus assembly protein TadD
MDTDTFGVTRTNEPAKVELTAFGDTFQGLQTIAPVEYHASDQALAEAKNQFRQENYGNAGALFYKAVQLSPNDGEAWLGLAACSDRIRRFDLADAAYARAQKLIGSTPEYYNNIGYSYLLRGKLPEARSAFLKAYELAPNDPTVENNLRLLQSSRNSIQR